MVKKSKIELLFVFGFLLLMALTVIFTFDPLEKQKEQKDASLKDAASKIIEGISNFSQSKGRYPWADNFASDSPYPALAWSQASAPQVGVCKNDDCLLQGDLVKKNFLDPFILREKVSEIYLGKGLNPQDPIFACFIPNSKKERKKVGQLYQLEIKNPLSPTNPSACDENLDWSKDNPCYICIKE